MAELDELGFVRQPHTSAGRIPTDEGYRYYIDSLLQLEYLTLQERELIETRYEVRNEAFEELLTEMLRILSNFSGYTALAFSSGVRRILFKKLELVPVEPAKLLVALVSMEGLVKTAVVHMPYQIEQADLFRIARFLNEEFAGLGLEEIKQRLSLKLLSGSDSFFHVVKAAEDIVDLIFENCDKDKLYLEGARYLLEQPEFQNAGKSRAILSAIERQEPLLAIMKEDLDQDGIKVFIGKESSCEDIQECSLVISNFKMKNRNMGALGIIGPRRMSYSKVITTVGYMARVLGGKIAGKEL
jgi:heat-inducible transcriptional repressor